MPYGNKQTAVLETPVPSAATGVNGNSGALSGYGYATTIRAQLAVTAASGTTPNLTAFIEDTLDGGTNWNVIGTFTAATGVTQSVINITTPFADTVRVRWVITGATPSFTFSVTWVVDRPGV